MAAGDVACLLLRLAQYGDELLRAAARILAPAAHAKDVAFLVESQFMAVPAIGADGVHLANFDNTAEARRQLGATISIGTTCLSRDDAFSAAEQGADYVAFGGFDDPAPTPMTIALVEWWSEIMTVPCVAAGGTTLAACGPLIAAGADFLALAGAAWAGADGPDLIDAISREIAAAENSRG